MRDHNLVERSSPPPRCRPSGATSAPGARTSRGVDRQRHPHAFGASIRDMASAARCSCDEKPSRASGLPG